MGFLAATLQGALPSFGPRPERALQEGPLPLTAARILEWLGGGSTGSGAQINEQAALRIAAAWACIRVLSEDVGKLPLFVYRRLPQGGKERALNHPLYGLLHDVPNPHMTAMQLRETMMGHLLTYGNAYCNVERDPVSGRVRWLWPLRPDRMQPPTLAADGRLLYTYRMTTGEPISLTQDDVLHIRGLSSDGITGYSPVQYHRETLGWTLATREYAARFFGQDASPGGYLKSDKRISPEAAERLRERWQSAHQGFTNAHRMAVLEDGVTWEKIGLAPEDAQYLQTSEFQIQEIARIYRVPPHKIADLARSTYSNIEEQSIEYVSDALSSWVIRWEQQINKDLLTEAERRTFFVEHLLDSILRGKTVERAQALDIWRRNGIISADEWRAIENLNPLPNGEGQDYWMPANMLVVGAPVPVPSPPVPAQPTPAQQGAASLRRLIERNAAGEIVGILDLPVLTVPELTHANGNGNGHKDGG